MANLKEAMEWCAAQSGAIFLGQGVAAGGTGMSSDFVNVSMGQLIEFPVAEELQMGVSVGLALEGLRPVSVYPRWNFLLLAFNQLVQHLDRLPLYSGYRPKVLVRVAKGSDRPLDPGHQHKDCYAAALKKMVRTVRVIEGASTDAWKSLWTGPDSAVLAD